MSFVLFSVLIMTLMGGAVSDYQLVMKSIDKDVLE